MKLAGKMKLINRAKKVPPKDGVHRISKNGTLLGPHGVYFNGEIIPKGMTAFYKQLDKETGLKVFYSIKKEMAHKKSAAVISQRNQEILYNAGLSPRPGGIKQILLVINNKKFEPWAHKTRHVEYPKKPWEMFLKGYPYNWNAVKHQAHSPGGFLRFREQVRRGVGLLHGVKISLTDSNLNLGNIIWDNNHMRWYLVDTL